MFFPWSNTLPIVTTQHRLANLNTNLNFIPNSSSHILPRSATTQNRLPIMSKQIFFPFKPQQTISPNPQHKIQSSSRNSSSQITSRSNHPKSRLQIVNAHPRRASPAVSADG
jgi:hypothetical protein